MDDETTFTEQTVDEEVNELGTDPSKPDTDGVSPTGAASVLAGSSIEIDSAWF